MDDNYDDIINLPCETILRPRMSRYDRAAQFAPFAALTGFGAVINETSRLTEKKPELDAESAQILNERIKIIEENIRQRPEIEVMYFVPDKTKSGGSIEKFSGRVRRIDEFERELIFTDKTKINMDDVIFIQVEFFKSVRTENP
ncbi:MAG: YolD-like family protein [Ruminococcus sp.]|nr:YolD-like family protein [Ruminococcus sp.]